MLDLERHDLGISIGNAYTGCPTCADDIVLLTSNQIELQEMLHAVDGYSKDHQFKLHPTKSKTILKTSSKKGYYEQATLQNDLRFGEDTMKLQTETVHLGLIRTSNETKINIEERISLDRRTLYSLIKSGVHGTNAWAQLPRTSYTRSIKYMSFQGFYMGWKPCICLKKTWSCLQISILIRSKDCKHYQIEQQLQQYIFCWEPPQY